MERPLAPHVFAALHGRDLVLLDLDRGDYDLIAGAEGALTLSEDRRQLRCSDDGLAMELDAMGLFGAEVTPVSRADPCWPVCSAITESKAQTAFADLGWMAAGLIDMAVRYHGRSLGQLLGHARRLETLGPGDEAAVLLMARSFDRLSIWLPFQGDCLYRCFFLLRRLGSAGRSVDWVFGVRTWPFYAHCWLQLGDTVLTDATDRLASFSPILVV